MKKVAFIVFCTFGILSLSSCRSISTSCGLAKNTKQTHQTFQQTIVVAKATVK